MIACPVFPKDYIYYSTRNQPEYIYNGTFLILGPSRGFDDTERKIIGEKTQNIERDIDESLKIEHTTAPYETAMHYSLPVIQYMSAKIKQLRSERQSDLRVFPFEIYPLINFGQDQKVNPLFSLINIYNWSYEGYVLANKDDKGAVEMKIQTGLQDGRPIFKNVWVRKTNIKLHRNLDKFHSSPDKIFT